MSTKTTFKRIALVAVAVSVVCCAAVADEIVRLSICCTADDGATERTPRPNPATARSAMRLNVVFEDMFFLSVVDPRTIRSSAWVRGMSHK